MAGSISFRDVSKRYRLLHQKPFLAKELLSRLLRRGEQSSYYWALRDLSFELGAGGSLGVIGVNGSGKSTLLSLIARTSYPTSGEVEVQGRVGPLLELGAGFHHDLTGFENVYLNAALLGLSAREVDARLDSIVEYAELGEFIQSPIKTYSTGMKARLGFAVIAHAEPDVLLIDEALSVGDGRFQAKCEATMEKLRGDGRTLVVVSHAMESVRRLCAHCLWIDDGRVVHFGPTEEVLPAYSEFLTTGVLPEPG